MNKPPPVPPGWYPVGDSERYWNGSAWTAQVRPPRNSPAPWPAQDRYGLPHQWAAETGTQGWPPQPVNRPAPYGPPVVPGYGYPPVAPKAPGISVLASFFLPGLGSMINGDVGKGVAILVGYFISWLLVLFLIGIVGTVALSIFLPIMNMMTGAGKH